MPDQDSNQNAHPFLQYQNATISDEMQQMLNNPIAHPHGIDPKDAEFLAMIMEKVDKGEIHLHQPSTLINHAVYDQLKEEAQGKADYNAMNLLFTIREIRKLWIAGQHDTYQVENLVHQLRLTKERLEELGGDIYII